jgi:hypothetical protein
MMLHSRSQDEPSPEVRYVVLTNSQDSVIVVGVHLRESLRTGFVCPVASMPSISSVPPSHCIELCIIW